MSQGSQDPSLPIECSLISERTDISISLVLQTVLELSTGCWAREPIYLRWGNEA